MWGRPKPPKYLGTDRQARVATWVVVTLLALAVFFVITLLAAVF
jgi:hypothetical protein